MLDARTAVKDRSVCRNTRRNTQAVVEERFETRCGVHKKRNEDDENREIIVERLGFITKHDVALRF